MMKFETMRKRAVSILAPEEFRCVMAESILRLCKDKLAFVTYLHVSGRLHINMDDRTVFSLPVSETCGPKAFPSPDHSAGEETHPDAIFDGEEREDAGLPKKKRRKRKKAVDQDDVPFVESNGFQEESNSGNDVVPQDNDGGEDAVTREGQEEVEAIPLIPEPPEENTGNLCMQDHKSPQEHAQLHSDNPMLSCVHCEEKFIQQDMEKHVGLVHDRQLLCDDCSLVFSDVSGYENHMKDAHAVEAMTHKCKSCVLCFSLKEDLLKHKQLQHFFKCSFCDRSFSNAQAQHRHERREHASCSMLTCNLCEEICTSVAALRKHKQRHKHRENGGLTCDVCGKKFSDKSSLYHHKKGLHATEKRFSCSQCDAKFNFNNSLKLHMLKHKGVRPHKCKICDKSYLTATHLKSHMLGIHAAEKHFVCVVCGKQFPYENSLRMHMLLHTSDRPFKCSYCSKGFVSKTGLKIHENSHSENRRFMCEVCHKLFKTETQMKAHLRRHTDARNRFMCDICGSHFMFKSALLAHVPTHENSNPNECSICHKTFKTYSSLYSHKLVHSTAKPFVCSVCNKGFKTCERLRTHEQRHLGLKPFACSECGNCFPDKGGLAKHMRTVHSRNMMYSCPVCHKKSNRTDNLRVHMKIHGDPSLLALSRDQLVTNVPVTDDTTDPQKVLQAIGFDAQQPTDHPDLSFMIQVAENMPQQLPEIYQHPPQLPPVEVMSGVEIQHLQPLANVQPMNHEDVATSALAQAHAELQAQADGAVALAQLSSQPMAQQLQLQPQISLQQLQEFINAQEMQRKLQPF